jgi:putative transposase
MLLELPPKYSVAEAVQKIKSITSQHLRKRFKFIDRIYDHSGIWSVGYFASSVGLNESQIKKYIERQNQQDLGIDLTSEFS